MAKLLLVDDDEDLSESLKELFELQAHHVDVARDGLLALQYLSQNQYDLIMLDWQLPDMPGLDVCKRYRDNGGETPVLILSGMRDAQSLEAGKEAGASSHLSKPFSVPALLKRVEELLP